MCSIQIVHISYLSAWLSSLHLRLLPQRSGSPFQYFRHEIFEFERHQPCHEHTNLFIFFLTTYTFSHKLLIAYRTYPSGCCKAIDSRHSQRSGSPFFNTFATKYLNLNATRHDTNVHLYTYIFSSHNIYFLPRVTYRLSHVPIRLRLLQSHRLSPQSAPCHLFFTIVPVEPLALCT